MFAYRQNSKKYGYSKKRKMNFGRFMTVVITILILLKIYYELKLLDLMVGICKLELGGKSIASVSQKSLMYIMRSDDDENIFYAKMNAMGWKLSGIYGRGYLFENRGEEVLVTKRRHFIYSVYEIQGKQFFMDRIGELA